MPAPSLPHHPERFFQLASDVLAVLALDGTITAVNDAGRRVLGAAHESDLIGRRWQDLIHPDDRAETADFARAAASGKTAGRKLVNRYPAADGSTAWIEWTVALVDGAIYASGRNVTAQRLADERLARGEALWQASFEQAAFGIALFTLDGDVVAVNPSFCALLQRTPEELIGQSWASFTDEEDAPGASARAERLRSDEVQTYEAERRYVRPGGEVVWAHIAVAMVTTPDGHRRFLAQTVDITERKHAEARRAEDLAQLASLQRVRDALDEDRLVVYSQPIVDLATGCPVREELLVRIEEDGALLTPDAFLPAAERFGLVVEIDRWVIGRALELAAAGRAVNVNVAATSLSDELLRPVEEAVAAGLAPALLCLEITETTLADDMATVTRFADRVRSLGCGLAIDDFGVGYGSLVYLRSLAGVTCLKIDRSFVGNVLANAEDQQIVEALIRLADGLGHQIVAEGIEDAETAEHLRAAGVGHGQGYLFGRPAPVAVLTASGVIAA